MWSLLFVDILHWKKYPYISSDVSWRVFCILTEPVTQTSPSEFLRFTDTNVHITGSVKIRKTRHKISVDIWIFFTVWNSSLYDAPLFCCSIFQLIGMIGISSCICVDSVCYRFRALLLLHFFHFFCTECCRNQIVWYWCTSCSIADQVPIYSRWVWDSRLKLLYVTAVSLLSWNKYILLVLMMWEVILWNRRLSSNCDQ